MRTANISKFTCSVYRFISPLVGEALKKCNIDEYLHQPSRAVISIEKKRLLFSKRQYLENIMDTYHFSCEPEREEEVFNKMVSELSLNLEGRGSLYVEPAIVIDGLESKGKAASQSALTLKNTKTSLMGIYCIIQRGKGNSIAKAAIDAGTSAPSIFYGVGGGIRDRMGLIRITIPTEKEMVNIIVAEHDCPTMMNILVDAGNLSRPGMGFIFSYPVTRAATDTKTHIGRSRAAASVGQIVKAIDELKTNTEWRKRAINPLLSLKERSFLKNLENITLICDDTKAKEMLDKAMCAGATGATLSKSKRNVFSKKIDGHTARSVEMADMVIPSSLKTEIVQSLIDAGFFDEGVNGQIMIRKSPLAFSYIESLK
ncbi:MAG: hypothetical protein ACOX2F_05945 [bacterium]